ncbi:MAG: hypothetical protein ABI142_07885, partial [Bryocella sp.]
GDRVSAQNVVAKVDLDVAGELVHAAAFGREVRLQDGVIDVLGGKFNSKRNCGDARERLRLRSLWLRC